MDESIDALLEKTELTYMLEFETQMFLDIIHNDGLVIASKGINLNLVILNLLKVYCDPGNLVLVLNSTENEEKYFQQKINEPHVSIISTNVNEREDIYLSGGIVFVSTRILVVDMLKKRLPIEKITGIVVFRAHTVFESCQEALVLRLFRQNNKTGFIKGFSNSAQSFTIGFGHVEKIMRALFVKELFLWPRFHALIVQSLKKHQPNVIELHIPVSEKMKKMQTYILELMNLTVKELKRINKGVELQEITVENCLTKKYHKILQAQLDVIWHQLSQKSLELISDLKTLRHLIATMFYSDPITYYTTIMGYRSKEYAHKANWVLLQAADLLFSQINSFIFNSDKEFNPEFCAKWKVLLELLKVEIPAQMKKAKLKENTIVILCSDHRTCHQLNEILTHGPQFYLFMKALKQKVPFKKVAESFANGQKLPEVPDLTKKAKILENSKKLKIGPGTSASTSSETISTTSTEEDVDEESEFQSSYILTMSQVSENKEKETKSEADLDYSFEPCTQLENMDLTQICESITEPKIVIKAFKGRDTFVNLQHALETLKPTFIIMYHISMTAVREVEMYEAHRKRDTPLQVYFLLHGDTVEEQSYLTTLRREKDCFELLIRTKSTMVVPEDQDGKSDTCTVLERAHQSSEKNTRAGGKDQLPKKQFIIVDMREFRSELPALIHKRGIEIEPVTITVGDYILTPEICVERKSLSDLIGSLNSGRLYQQCKQMSRFYAKPMLLIEFDQNKRFGWQSNFMMSTDSNNFDVQQKLLLLTLHFPKLRIIWSPNAYASAQLFEELKTGKDEPNVEYAAAIGQQDLDLIETKYHAGLYDFVQKLPGITSKNIDIFLRKMGSLDDVLKATEEELKEILGNSADAQAFYSILHEEQKPSEDSESSKSKGKAPMRRRQFKNV